jgi:hypothetical protein
MPYADYEKQKQNARDNYYKNKVKRLKQVKEYYLKNWDKRAEQKKAWQERNVEKIRAYHKDYYQEYYKSFEKRRVRSGAVAKWLGKNKEKTLCHYVLRNAVRRGDVIRPNRCIECGTNGKIHAHHPDYNKPLAVMWLCAICHSKQHKKEKQNG